MRKILSFFLSVMLLLSLCACGSSDVPGSTTENPGGGQAERPKPVNPSSSSSAQIQPEKPLTITYDEATKTILVSGNGVVNDYNSTSSRRHDEYKDKAVRIVVEEGCIGIGKNAFSEFSLVTEVILPSSLTYIGAYAFSSCESLTTISFPDNLSEIGAYAFKNCKVLTTVDLPKNLHTLDSGAFENCESLKNVTIYDAIRYLAPYVFRWCPLEYTEYNGIMYMGNAENPYVVAVEVDDSDAEQYVLADTTIMVGPYAFNECSVSEITIPDSVLVLAGSAFKRSALESIQLSSNLLRIGDECFKYCGRLTSVDLPDTLTHIGMNAFDECTGLSQITLPASLVEIGNTPFKYTAITQITYLGSIADWEKITKQDSGKNATVHCTDGDVTF